uniref:Uncharacterized protein n=1 Tax=Laticauda laticaudata TaxID=8630 RepID=A0A8C5WUD5_LATLA
NYGEMHTRDPVDFYSFYFLSSNCLPVKPQQPFYSGSWPMSSRFMDNDVCKYITPLPMWSTPTNQASLILCNHINNLLEGRVSHAAPRLCGNLQTT